MPAASSLHDFFAVLAIIAAVGVIALIVARFIPSVAAVRFLDAVYKVQLPLAALVASTATIGSLLFSEHYRWEPCRMCWFQRIFMYSSAVVLIVAAIRRDRSAKWYAGTLAIVGIFMSGWHILIEHNVIGESKVCTTPCAVPYYISFGDERTTLLGPAHWWGITLAVMAFTGFAAILALLFLPQRLDDESSEPAPPDTSLEDHDGEPQAS